MTGLSFLAGGIHLVVTANAISLGSTAIDVDTNIHSSNPNPCLIASILNIAIYPVDVITLTNSPTSFKMLTTEEVSCDVEVEVGGRMSYVQLNNWKSLGRPPHMLQSKVCMSIPV